MPFAFFFDSSVLIVLPALIFTMWAQARVRSAYSRYAQVGTRRGLSGAQVARRIMLENGIDDVEIEAIPGEMTDHYDPIHKVVRLSEGVYNGNSVAALGIASHEIGHVIQHARGYAPLKLRHFMYPVSSLGSKLGMGIFFLGFIACIFAASPATFFIAKLGIYFFGAAVVFTLVTLPVEFNASSRALRALAEGGYLMDDEMGGAKAVLNAAALTYVAAAAMAVLTLVRLMVLLGGVRDD
jgi:uncharacterized protein